MTAPMSRPHARGRRLARSRTRAGVGLSILGAFALATFAACGAFSLNDVVPVTDGGAPVDGSLSDRMTDAAMGDGGIRDASPDSGPTEEDSGADAACVPDGDPCACLAEKAQVTAGPGTTAAMALVDASLFWLSPPKTGSGQVSPYTLAADAVEAGIPDAFEGPFPLSTAQDQMPMASGRFYFGSGKSVVAFPLDGDGGLDYLVINLPTDADAVVVGPRGVYWTNSLSQICHAELDGGLSPPLTDSGCGSRPLVAAIDGGASSANNYLALNDFDLYLAIGETGDIVRASILGGKARAIYSGHPGARLVFASNVDLVWRDPNAANEGTLRRSLPDGGDPKLLVRIGEPIDALLVDTEAVFFTTAKTIQTAPRDGGAASLLVCNEAHQPHALAVDDTFLYWGDSETSGVWKVPKVPK
jgi:hypothetical protein